MDKIFLHAGTYKTGTTTIQKFLSENAKQLAEKGFFYPQPIIKPLWKAHHELAAWADRFTEEFSVLSHFNVINEKQKLEFDSRVELYYKQILKNSLIKNKSLILSSEFIFNLSTDAVEKIKQLLSNDPREIRIIIYLRRMDLLLISFYKQNIWTGNIDSDKPVFDTDTPLFRFRKVIEGFIRIFGKKSMVIKAFDNKRFINADLIDDFLSILGIRGDSELKRVPSENEGISFIEAKVLIECLKHISPFAKTENKELRSPLWHVLTSRIKALDLDGERNMFVSRGEALSLYEKCKADYCWIKDAFMQDFPYPTLFDEDFSLYDEVYSPPEFTFEQGIEIMLKVWEQEYKERMKQEK